MAVSKTGQAADKNIVTMDRRRGDRRSEQPEAHKASQVASPRRKKQRRRHIDPTTCERDYSEQEIEFMRAMDDYKRDSGRMFPTCSEVLEVIRALGYFQLTEEQLEELGLNQQPGSEESDPSEVSDEEDAFEETLA